MSIIRMSKWVHLACGRCRERMTLPEGTNEKLPECITDGTERCCWCGQKGSPTYYCVRLSPRLVRCRGIHRAEPKFSSNRKQLPSLRPG